MITDVANGAVVRPTNMTSASMEFAAAANVTIAVARGAGSNAAVRVHLLCRVTA